jgi:hypothetical protein
MLTSPHRPTSPAPVPVPAAPSTPVVAAPKVMKHDLQPDWGMGLIVEDDGKYLVLYFEKAGLKKFIKDKAKVLVPVTLAAAEMTALKSKANGRSKKPRPEGSAKKKAKAKAVAKARFTTVADQITAFEKLFAGGFAGEAFVEGERGKQGVEGKEGLKEAAIAFAQKTLSKEAFAKSTPEELFENARLLLKATNIVFPIEGAIPFAGMDPENRTKALAALKDLLHGAADYADRVEAFAGAVTLKDSKGTLNRLRRAARPEPVRVREAHRVVAPGPDGRHQRREVAAREGRGLPAVLVGREEDQRPAQGRRSEAPRPDGRVLVHLPHAR